MKPLSAALPSPQKVEPSMWLEESIWCHRLYDEQTPWLVFLEFLNVFFSEDLNNRAFEEPEGPNTLKYRPAQRLHLRNILFNNTIMDELRSAILSDQEKWRKYFDEMSDAPGLISPKFEYLKKHFEKFDDFCEVVSILRSTSLEISSNKRWTSKFPFPYGKDCLFEDMDAKAKSNDRRFFGRSGEILYLMLCRSNQKKQILPLLKNIFLEDQTMNQLAKCLQHFESDTSPSDRGGTYLPYSHHDCFDLLGEDWLSILQLEMPGFDKFPHLVNLSSFNLLCYQQTVAAQFLKNQKPPFFVCEILAPKRTLVRELSINTYQNNNYAPSKVVEEFIHQICTTQEWLEALHSEAAFISCKKLLEEKTKWGEDYSGSGNPDSLINTFRESALKRHRQHFANIHRVFGREIGLISKRGTNKLRYAPNDAFLKSIIFANVSKRLELNEFLKRLFDRYGLIFSDRQAEEVYEKKEIDKKAFQANVERLEQRLASLGLLRRLSDGCAYLINPYFNKIHD
ncbi:MAG: hypothetical protein HQM10_11020 [Candidatus Riflebacteria bacterium]|nr:hypothetical protein [Candidatus Riflebacteria bacterium]